MQRFFDTKKQQGKTVDIFAAKKTQIDLTSPDRNVSPFRGYKQAPSPSLARNPEMSVSRGIFSTKKDTSRDEITPQARLAMNSDSERGTFSNYGQVFQDFLNNELRSQIGQFRTEIVQMMNESFKDFREKSNKNQETLGAIKDSIKNNSHNVEKLDEKVEEYHSSLEMISTMFQSEIEKIKNNLPHSRGGSKGDAQLDQRFQKMESDIQEMLVSFDRLKDEITQGVQLTLEEYGQVSEQESNNKIDKITGEININMENKIHQALDQINQRIASLESQSQAKPDEASNEKLKFEMEEKLSEQISALRQQVQSLYQMMENTTRSGQSSPNKEGSPELERRAELSRFEYENLKAELTAMIDHARSEGKGLHSRFEESDKKFNVELNQIREQIKAYQAENSSSAGLTQQTRDEFEKRIIVVEKRLDEIRQEQRDLNSNISIQKAQLESFKTTAAITMNDIKANQSQLEEVQLRKIDLTIEQLAKSIENIKTNPSLNDSLSSTKFSEGSNPTKLENFNSFGYSATTTSAHQEGQIREKSGLDAYRSEQHAYEQGASGYQRGFSGSAEQTHKETSPEKHASPEKKPSSEDFQSSYLPSGASMGSGNKRDTLHPDKEFGQSGDKWGSGNKHDTGLGEPRPWEKVGTDYYSPVKGDQNIQTITVSTSLPAPAERKSVEAEANEDEEVEVVYQIDENGFLMDEDGNYIYDDKGEMIKLNDDQIERLRENNLLEEEEENQ